MEKKLRVVSVDKENATFLCDDGNEYPLLEGLDNLTKDEIEEQINKAKKTTLEFLKEIGVDD
jgi:translation elongation factor P/translation initiation factor 5A